MTLRELRYVILGDDRLSSKLDHIGSASDKVGKKLTQNSEKLSFFRKNVEVASNVVPGFSNQIAGIGSAAALMSAPLAVAALGVAGVGLALNKGVNDAKAFELEFSKLRNLNLDKTTAQINQLKSKILEISFEKGFDPGKTANAYFDVQSLTGEFGKSTEDVIKKQGEVAKVMDADFNKYITGSAAAMKNFGFGFEGLDKYNKSLYATMQTALVTYDQLSQVSTIFSGAASAARQTPDSANKLFALFTPLSKTGSPEEAATLAKTAFQDLFKEETVKSFKSAGIDVFDKKGTVKQVGDIILELNKKFNTLGNDRSLVALQNKFKGSEGLIALVKLATDKSGNLVRTLKAFDTGEFNYLKALKDSGEDINKINDAVSNKLTTSFAKLGETVLPLLVSIKKGFIDIIDSVNSLFNPTALQNIVNANNKENDVLFSGKSKRIAQEGKQGIYDEIVSKNKLSPEQIAKMSNDEFSKKVGGYLQSSMNFGNELAKNGDKLPVGTYNMYLGSQQAYSKLNKDMWADRKKLFGETGMMPATKKKPGSSSIPASSSSISNGISGIAGGGTRNVTVTFKNLVENFTVSTTNLKESGPEVKRIMEEYLVRAVAGAEQTLGTN